MDDIENVSLVFVANARYQRYLDFMAFQLKTSNCPYDRFVISHDDVRIPTGFEKIDVGRFIREMSLEREYEVNPPLRDALWKLYIPLAPELKPYGRVLFMDLDIELKPGWDGMFGLRQTKPVLATKDVGVWPGAGLSCFKHYAGRKFTYANTGVMLFDMALCGKFFTPEIVRTWIDTAYADGFVYADQDVLNAMDVIDCDLPAVYNCYRRNVKNVWDAKVVHYTAEIGVKEKFDELITERMRVNNVNN